MCVIASFVIISEPRYVPSGYNKRSRPIRDLGLELVDIVGSNTLVDDINSDDLIVKGGYG